MQKANAWPIKEEISKAYNKKVSLKFYVLEN